MSKIQGLRLLVEQFLSAAADQIVEAVETMISGYEEEMHQYKRQIGSNRLSEEAQLNLSVWEEDLLAEQQQEWNSSQTQKNSDSLQTERSLKEPLSSSQDRRPEDNDAIHDTSSQYEQNEHETYKVEEEPLQVTSEQMPIETDEEVPSPGFSEALNRIEDDWNATQDGDDGEDWTPSRQRRALSGKTPRTTKKKQKSSIVCKVCEKSFHSELSLVKHLEVHPKDVCGLCGMHFETEDDFELHLKTHLNVKGKVCDVCGKCFAPNVRPSYLKEHMRSHTGVKPFRCEECGRHFSRHQNMTRHLRIHTGEKSYACNSCSKCFSSYYLLKQHMVNHIVNVQEDSSNPGLPHGKPTS